MKETNGEGGKPKRVRPRVDVIWTEDEVKEIHDMADATGKSMKEIVQTATRLYLTEEKRRLAKLLKLRAKLLPN